MTGPAFERILDALREAGRPVTMDGPNRARSSCPGHAGDNRTALSVMDGETRVSLHCFTAGCESDAILAGLGLSWQDRYHENRRENVATYTYDDGRRVFRKRSGPKEFRQAGANSTPTLYRLARVRDAVAAGRPVWLVEGEEDTHALESLGVCATTAPMGAGNFAKVDASPLRGASVVAVVDRDARGAEWAAAVRDKLAGVAAGVRFVCAASGKDASDHLAAGRTLDDFAPYPPQDAPRAPLGDDDAPDDYGPWQDTTPPEEAPSDLMARLVADEVRRLRVRQLAQDAVRAADRPAAEPFDLGTLAEVLARPTPPLARVEGLMPWGASVLLVATRKTGKTTAVLNLARALLTGEDYLGRFHVRPVAGAVAVLNFEVSGHQLAQWAQDHRVPEDRFILVNLRGRRNPLDDDADRAELARLLRAHGVETLIVDPFGRAYSGESQNDAAAVGQWLVRLDRFARTEVGALDLVLTAHAGWNGERTRGSSALEDWADVIVTMTRDEQTDARFLRAEGRDVTVTEDRLDFDPETRALTLTGAGGRKVAAKERHVDELVSHVVRIVTEEPGVNGSQVEARLKADEVPGQRGDGRKALAVAVSRGLLRVTEGPRGAKLYHVGEAPTPTYPDVPPGTCPTYPDPTLSVGVGQGVPEALTYPEAETPPIVATGRSCADCDEPVAAGMIRCAEHLANFRRGGAR